MTVNKIKATIAICIALTVFLYNTPFHVNSCVKTLKKMLIRQCAGEKSM